MNIFKQSFTVRKELAEATAAKLAELSEQLRLTSPATQIDIAPEQAESYFRMRDEFSQLSECGAIWDTLTRKATNQFAERTIAKETITRGKVRFSLGSCDLVHWDHKVPHLENRNGGDLYLFPGFVLYRASKQAFSVIDSREVQLVYRPRNFIESEAVPSDTKIIGQTWAKANKDGSPDRRFADNHQIPIVLYGSMEFTSPSGLREEYQLSNPDPTARFVSAWDAFTSSFDRD